MKDRGSRSEESTCHYSRKHRREGSMELKNIAPRFRGTRDRIGFSPCPRLVPLPLPGAISYILQDHRYCSQVQE